MVVCLLDVVFLWDSILLYHLDAYPIVFPDRVDDFDMTHLVDKQSRCRRIHRVVAALLQPCHGGTGDGRNHCR